MSAFTRQALVSTAGASPFLNRGGSADRAFGSLRVLAEGQAAVVMCAAKRGLRDPAVSFVLRGRVAGRIHAPQGCNLALAAFDRNALFHYFMWMLRVNGGRGVRVDDRRDARAWKQGILGFSKQWGEAPIFSSYP